MTADVVGCSGGQLGRLRAVALFRDAGATLKKITHAVSSRRNRVGIRVIRHALVVGAQTCDAPDAGIVLFGALSSHFDMRLSWRMMDCTYRCLPALCCVRGTLRHSVTAGSACGTFFGVSA